jgi:hypothetical protein
VLELSTEQDVVDRCDITRSARARGEVSGGSREGLKRISRDTRAGRAGQQRGHSRMCTILTMNPMKPMMRKPAEVALATAMNSFWSGLVLRGVREQASLLARRTGPLQPHATPGTAAPRRAAWPRRAACARGGGPRRGPASPRTSCGLAQPRPSPASSSAGATRILALAVLAAYHFFTSWYASLLNFCTGSTICSWTNDILAARPTRAVHQRRRGREEKSEIFPFFSAYHFLGYEPLRGSRVSTLLFGG